MSGIVIEMPAAGRTALEVGQMYDYINDQTLVGVSLWSSEHIQNSQRIMDAPSTFFDLCYTEEERRKAHHFDNTASLSLSVGLFEVQGNLAYLKDNKTSKHEVVLSVTCVKKNRTRRITQEQLHSIDFPNVLQMSNVTHFISEVEEGGSAAMIFRYKATSEEEKIRVESGLKFQYQTLSGVNVGGGGNFARQDLDAKTAQKIKIKFTGDYSLPNSNVFGSYVAAMQEAVMFPQRLASVTNALSFKLSPLQHVGSKAPSLFRVVPVKIVNLAQRVIAALHDAVLDIDTLREVFNDSENLPHFDGLNEQLKTFRHAFGVFVTSCQSKISEMLMVLRRSSSQENSFDGMLDELWNRVQRMCKLCGRFVTGTTERYNYIEQCMDELRKRGAVWRKPTELVRTHEMDEKSFCILVDVRIMDAEEHPLETILTNQDGIGWESVVEVCKFWEDHLVMTKLRKVQNYIDLCPENKTDLWIAVVPRGTINSQLGIRQVTYGHRMVDIQLGVKSRHDWVDWDLSDNDENFFVSHQAKMNSGFGKFLNFLV